MRFVSSSHSYGEVALHMQFTPKKRRKIFLCEIIQKACRTSFEEIAMQRNVKLVACEFGPDHVHIFLLGWKNYAVSKVAQLFKGKSSRQLRKDFPDLCKKFRIPDSLWSDGYFYETCGNVTAEARKFYIERMQKKHWQSISA